MLCIYIYIYIHRGREREREILPRASLVNKPLGSSDFEQTYSGFAGEQILIARMFKAFLTDEAPTVMVNKYAYNIHSKGRELPRPVGCGAARGARRACLFDSFRTGSGPTGSSQRCRNFPYSALVATCGKMWRHVWYLWQHVRTLNKYGKM